jgi:hypothetical protein
VFRVEKENFMDPLFPALPEDLSSLEDEQLANLLQEHEVASELIENQDEDFIKDLSAEDVLAQYEAGVEQIEAILAEQEKRVKEYEEYQERLATLSSRRKAHFAEESAEDEAAEDEAVDEDAEEVADEADELAVAEAEPVETVEEASAVEEPVLVTASASEPKASAMRRRPPAVGRERQVTESSGTVLVAAGGLSDVRAGKVLDRMSLAEAIKITGVRRGPTTKSESGGEEKIRIASALYNFPEDRILDASDWAINADRIGKIIPAGMPGVAGNKSLTASGGLCAPLTPIYSMPNYAVQDRPVRDALPSFLADRGGVNVPEATTIGDITSAITTITEANDALGGTYATKSCQDMDCPAYTETAVTILSHCREFGNLNARAWPEKIAHEMDLTMAAHARTAEGYLLDRIKAQSVNVTNGAETLGALIYLVDGIVKAAYGIRSRLRMPSESVLRVLLPDVLPDLLQLDTVQTQFDRFTSEDAQAAGALDGLPDTLQWAIFPEGAFIHVDGGSLELGIVRDSTLNSTNDYQLFGETFENVARIGPSQACYWVTSDLCASGQFPPAGTVRTCD